MSALLSLTDVSVSRDGTPVLRQISMELRVGERLAIVGPNGAGKTTLLRTIVGLERAATGTVRLFGEKCADERHYRAMRPRIGFLFQDSDDQLFSPTVIEDVAFGPLNTGCSDVEARKRAMNALDDLDIGHLAERISHRLSGGEKRLVCLAGLLAMRPDVLLLDEPTNGMDPDNGRTLIAALSAFEGAIVLITHDTSLVAELASRTMFLENGLLVDAKIHTHPNVHPSGSENQD